MINTRTGVQFSMDIIKVLLVDIYSADVVETSVVMPNREDFTIAA